MNRLTRVFSIFLLTLLMMASPPAVTTKAHAGGNPFIGEIIMFGGNFAPRGWALCDGQLLPIASNSALFSILGTTYGGDGRTTFGLPDLRGRVAIHAGQGGGLSDYRLGERGGAENVTLTAANLPSHSHTATATSTATAYGVDDSGNKETPGSHTWARRTRDRDYSDSAPAVAMKAGSVEVETTVTVDSTGGNTAFSIIQPYNTVNYIIALVGTFPSRS